MNAKGPQDLIVHILARNQRYEVANYENVTIPTNIDVAEKAKDTFGEFYAALFDATVKKKAGAVVTEYAWDSSTCDPCPVPGLRPQELATLGLDVLDGDEGEEKCDPNDPLCEPGLPRKPMRMRRGFVLTRLHARYTKDSLGDDLVFKAADPIVGGREFRQKGKLEHGATKGNVNNFQGRYAIRHPWKGPIECENPTRGRWGGPPKGPAKEKVSPALDLAFAKRGGLKLASFIQSDVPELGLQAPEQPSPKPAPAAAPSSAAPAPQPAADGGGACGCRFVGLGDGDADAWLLSLFGVVAFVRRRRR
jgi:hypothetical protein